MRRADDNQKTRILFYCFFTIPNRTEIVCHLAGACLSGTPLICGVRGLVEKFSNGANEGCVTL